MAGEENQFKPKPAVFSEAFSRAWHGVYPISGFDPNNIQPRKFPSFHEESEDDIGLLSLDDAENLITRPGIRFLTFLGLPIRARKHTATGEGYARKLLLNFIGWPDIPFDNMSNVRKGLAVATAFIALPWHLITMPLKFIQNIAKLATEFLPRLASEYFFNQARTLRGQGKSLLGGVFAALGYVTYALYFIGRAVTSPIQGVRQAYNQNEMASGMNLKLSRPARMVLAALSGTLTVTVYSLLLPIVLPLIAAKVPLVAQGVAALSQTKAGIWIGKAFSAIGEFVNPVIGTALEALGIAAAPSVIVGGATLLGATAATVLPAIDKAIDKVSDKIDSSTKQALGELNASPVNESQKEFNEFKQGLLQKIEDCRKNTQNEDDKKRLVGLEGRVHQLTLSQYQNESDDGKQVRVLLVNHISDIEKFIKLNQAGSVPRHERAESNPITDPDRNSPRPS